MHPTVHHARFLGQEGMRLPDLVAAWGAPVGPARDLAIAGTAFVVRAVAEARGR